MGDSDSGYQFASGDELARLEVQGSALGPATRIILDAAGIRPGMRVLDLGCGVGDVAFLAADLVGPDGRVVGVDRWPEAIARAHLRAGQAGLAQVQFVEGDIREPVPGGPFDAIVGRLVLMHLADPVTALRRQATVLRAGGLVVQIEHDIHTTRSLPPTPLVAQTVAVAPLLERTGIATAEEIGVETFGQRLKDELQTNSAVLAPAILLGAWATTNP